MNQKRRKSFKRKVAILLAVVMIAMQINIPTINSKAANVEYNYAKLLQYSLYFYDANMCGSDVGSKSLLSWRGNCHTSDSYTYTRKDGSQVNVNLNGGFHDAGDHVKFGLPEAYSAFVLGMSYDAYKDAYTSSKQEGHLKTITTRFADYLVNCTVLDASGANVEAFCCQVGQGSATYDHGYWGAPENQNSTSANRPIYFTSDSAPSTDIVSLSAAALVMQYKNFGGDKYLTTAKKLFAYAKNNDYKACNTTAKFNGTDFYNSTTWKDDYCLAAIMLFNATGIEDYRTEYYKYSNDGMNVYWAMAWDNVGPAVAYYGGQASMLSNIMNLHDGTTVNGYRSLNDWGSARYNTSMQFTGLLYDKATSSSTNRSWAEGQMQYLLGNNSANRCYVVGYNSYSSKYPHHRAASGYTGGPQGTTTQAHVLIGALVGGPSTNGSYEDTANNYQYNEVAIDYNATLVAAAAGLYSLNKSNTSTQYIDPNYYSDSNVNPNPTPDPQPSTVSVTGVKVSPTSMSLEKGKMNGLTATVQPSNATNTAVSWSSSNTSVATVDSKGVITALNTGTSTITVKTSDGGHKATCKLTVTEQSAVRDGWYKNSNGTASFYRQGTLAKDEWLTGPDKELRYVNNKGIMIVNQFMCDGVYTYYLQADGSPMKNRLTYHPDGEHLIYFDDKGHELFDKFQYCKDVGYTCYFNTFGYLYKNEITFSNGKTYYLDGTGRMKQNEWFKFDNGVDIGYANADGSLINNGFSYDPWGRVVYYHWNGMVARGLISDGVWYYHMDEGDGHLIGQFK